MTDADAVPPGGAPREEPSRSTTEGVPAPVGPPHPTELRASDADRERVAERLRDAMAEGRLDMAEFEERLEATYRAKTYGELAPLTRDLPPAGHTGAAPGGPPVSLTKPSAPVGAAGTGPSWAARIGRVPTSSGGVAIMGGFERRGRWTIARLFTAFTLMGGAEIDLREASFEDRVTEIRCFTIMGGIQVTVPPELNVEVSGIGIMGAFADDTRGEADVDAPVVRITGFALMGGVEVERKLTRAEKERRRAEQRQFKAEQRQLKHEARAARREARRTARRREVEARHDSVHRALEGRREFQGEFRHEAHREARDGRDGRDGRRSGRRGRYAPDDSDH